MQETQLGSLGGEDPQRRKWQLPPAFFLENPMARGAWRTAVHGVAELCLAPCSVPAPFSESSLSRWEVSTPSLTAPPLWATSVSNLSVGKGRRGVARGSRSRISLSAFPSRGQDGWMASLTQRTWVCAHSGRQWRTGKPGVLRSTRLERVRRDSNRTTTLLLNTVELWAHFLTSLLPVSKSEKSWGVFPTLPGLLGVLN